MFYSEDKKPDPETHKHVLPQVIYFNMTDPRP